VIVTHHRPDAPVPIPNPVYEDNLSGIGAMIGSAAQEAAHVFGPLAEDTVKYAVAFMLLWFIIDLILSAIIPNSGDVNLQPGQEDSDHGHARSRMRR
jgi:hypothetical protein